MEYHLAVNLTSSAILTTLANIMVIVVQIFIFELNVYIWLTSVAPFTNMV